MTAREPSIREVAVLFGHMVSSLHVPGVEYGELFYRNLDIAKTEALKLNYCNFDATMSISSEISKILNGGLITLVAPQYF